MPEVPDRPVLLTDEKGAPVTTVPTGRTERTATVLVYFLAAVLMGVLVMQSVLLLRVTSANQADSDFRRDVRALILCGRDQQCVNDVISGIRVRAGISVNPPVTITTPGPTVTSIVVVPVRPSTTQGTTGSTRATVGAPVTATTTPSTSRTTSTTTTTAPPRPTTTTTAPSSPSTTTTTATPLFCVQGHCLS